jgi:hypothetical protein
MVFDSLLRMDTEINSKINFFPEKFLKKKIQLLVKYHNEGCVISLLLLSMLVKYHNIITQSCIFEYILKKLVFSYIVIKDHFGHVTPNRENKMTYKSGTPRPDTSVP